MPSLSNKFKPNGISHSHQLDKFISKFRVVGWVHFVFFIFVQIVIEHQANISDPDQTPYNLASDLGLHDYAP